MLEGLRNWLSGTPRDPGALEYESLSVRETVQFVYSKHLGGAPNYGQADMTKRLNAALRRANTLDGSPVVSKRDVDLLVDASTRFGVWHLDDGVKELLPSYKSAPFGHP